MPETAPSITCPRCERTSWNPNDIAAGYCGACHWWTSDKHLGSIDPPTDHVEQASNDAGHAANLAYLAVLRDAGYGPDHDTWPTPLVPSKILNRATKAGETARTAARP